MIPYWNIGFQFCLGCVRDRFHEYTLAFVLFHQGLISAGVKYANKLADVYFHTKFNSFKILSILNTFTYDSLLEHWFSVLFWLGCRKKFLNLLWKNLDILNTFTYDSLLEHWFSVLFRLCYGTNFMNILWYLFYFNRRS